MDDLVGDETSRQHLAYLELLSGRLRFIIDDGNQSRPTKQNKLVI